MKKKEKEIRRYLQKMSMMLPDNYSIHKSGEEIIGSALIEMMEDQGKKPMDEDGNAIDPEKKYVLKTEQHVPVNHFRRMLRIGIKHGNDGIMQYFTEVMDLSYERPSSIGGVALEISV
jgi:hypothetical protein